MRIAARIHVLVCGWLFAGLVAAVVLLLPGVESSGHLVRAAATPATAPDPGDVVELVGLVERPGPLTVDELRRLPRETVTVAYRTSTGPEQHQFTGVRLYDVLQHVGVVPEPGDQTPLLRRYLIVSAKDDYRVVVSGGELDPHFGNAPLLLAWERDGHPLVGDEGPVSLVAPGDKLVSRYVYGVDHIEVLGIESAPEVGG